jgi:hypothetical protein
MPLHGDKSRMKGGGGGVIHTFADLTNLAGEVQGFTSTTRLLAILFMRKGQEITDKLIVPSLKYFDLRSGDNLHFILPGWTKRQHKHMRKKRWTEEWIYSDDDFERARKVIASETLWKYSGGTDLLLITTRSGGKHDIVLDFSAAINIPLHELKEKKLVPSLEVFFERLIRFAESYKGPEPLLHVSLQEGRVSLFEGVVNTLLRYVAKDMKDQLEYTKHFLIQDVSKQKPSGLALVGIRSS